MMRKAAIRMPLWTACALAVLLETGIVAAAEAPVAEASLQRALPASTSTEIDGINWQCSGDKCVGTAVRRGARGSRMDECRKVAATLGKLASFSSRGKPLNERDLENCNRVAR
jgi:hypothetical protein